MSVKDMILQRISELESLIAETDDSNHIYALTACKYELMLLFNKLALEEWCNV